MLGKIRKKTMVFLFDFLLFVFCLLGVYHVSQKPGLPVNFLKQNNRVLISKIYDPAGEKNLRINDIVHSINGYEISSVEDIEFICDGLKIGESVNIEIERNSITEGFNISLVPFYGVRYLIIMVFVGILFFSLGVFVLIKRPDEEASYIFHWAEVSVAVIVLTTWGNYSIKPFGLGYVLRIIFSTAYAFAPVFYFHFALVFPHNRFKKVKKVLIPLYTFAGLLSIWMGINFLRSTFPVSLNNFHDFMLAFDTCRWFFSICMVLGVISFIISYRHAVEESERRKLRWVFLGLGAAAIGFITLWQIPQALTSAGLIDEDFILLISAAAPISSTISIIRYHLLNIDLIFNRSAVYTMVLLILLIIYTIIIGLIGTIIGTYSITSSLLASAGAAVVVALLLEPARKVVQQFVDKKFFRVKYNYRIAQKKFIDEIRSHLDIYQIANSICNEINELLSLRCIVILLFQKSGNLRKILSCLNVDSLTLQNILNEIQELDDTLKSPMGVDNKVESGTMIKFADAKLFQSLGISIIFPMLSRKNKNVGLLIVGDKKSGGRFTVEDIDLLSTISTEVGFAIERIMLQEELLLKHEEARQLKELGDLKSYFISSVSHELKTPLSSIRMFAEMLETRKDISPEKSNEYLEIIQGESNRLARLIDNVLDFSKIERGIKEYHFSPLNINNLIRSLLNTMQYQFEIGKFKLEIDLCKEEYLIMADYDAVLEAIINLLSNAMKYSSDIREINISTHVEENYIVVSIEDKGIGISEQEIKNIFEPFYRAKDEKTQGVGGAGLGLSLVKHIMDAHKGRVKVQSQSGEGSVFSLYFPMEVKSEKDINN
jgi:signal transduction histidine kinase